MDAYEVRKRVAELLRADREAGRLRSLAGYQRDFPGYDEIVAREYAAEAPGAPSSVARSIDWLPARQGERYRHLGEIARGGMGAIIRVRDESLKRELAMKVVLGKEGQIPASSPGTEAPLARRFLEEAQITAQLDHPGVVPVHELGADDEGRLFFTMKLIKGGRTLADVFRLSRAGDPEFSLARVVDIFIRVLETLAFAHEKGVVHRDLKPANVMVGHFGEVYVMDWGLAKITDSPTNEELTAVETPASESGVGLTQVGQVLGTPAYMPIEQARSEPIDARADVYAVGAMFYEYLAGSPPYGVAAGLTGADVLRRLLGGPPMSLRRLASTASTELVSIVEKAMARERENRYATAMDLASDLRNFLEGRVVFAHEGGPWAELRKWIGRNRALAGSLAAGVLLLVAGLAVAVTLGVRADQERLAARWQAYRADIGAAVADLQNQDLHAARVRLERTPEDLRGWEWRHVVSRLDEGLATLDGASVAFSSAGHLLVLDSEGRVLEIDLGRGGRRVLGSVSVRGEDAWITADGEHVCVVSRHANARDRHDVQVVPVGQDGPIWTAVLDLADDRWDRASRMPRFVYTGTDRRLHVLELETGRNEVPPSLAAEGEFDLVPPTWDSRFALLERGAALEETGTAVVYDLETGRILLRLRRPREAAVNCLALDPAGARAVVGTIDGSVELYDLATGEPTGFGRLKVQQGVTEFVTVHPDGRILATGGTDRVVRLVDLSTGGVVRTYQGHLRALAEGHFTPNGEYLVTRDAASRVRVWPVEAGDTCVLRGHASYVYAVAFSPDGARLYSGGWDGFADREGALRVWDVATGEPIVALGGDGLCVVSLAVTRDGRRIVTVGGEQEDYRGGSLKVWDAETGRILREHAGVYRTLGLHPDGRRAVVNDFRPFEVAEPALVVLDLETGAVLATLLRKPVDWAAYQVDAACSPDGRFFATPDAQGTAVVLWDAATYREVRRIHLPEGVVTSLDFAPDGSTLLTTADDDSWRVYEVATGRELAVQSGTGIEVLASAYTPSGRRIVTGGRDRNLRLWDAATREEIVRLPGHLDYVKDVAVSPDGEAIASASGDATVRLWHTRTAEETNDARMRRTALRLELSPRVTAMFDSFGNAAAAVEQLKVELRGPALEVALQLALQESVARSRAPPAGEDR